MPTTALDENPVPRSNPYEGHIRGEMKAGSEELPQGRIRRHSDSGTLRPRFVMAGMIVVVASFGIVINGVLAATTDIPMMVLAPLGIVAVTVALLTVMRTWPERRVGAVPRIGLGVLISFVVFALGAALAMFFS